jgi:molybdopterin molybdotransferase
LSETWSVEEHLDDILSSIRPLEPIELQLLDAQGCVLVEDVTVPASLPPFDNSSMDGYAVRVTDVQGAAEEFPAVLTVIGDVAAGTGDLPVVGRGQAARIMTGAALPPGAEAVVPVEWTDGGLGGGPVDRMLPGAAIHSTGSQRADGEVRIHRPVTAGQHVRPRGSDVRAGAVALSAGTVLGPPQVGLLAAIGRGSVKVRPRPRVVVVSTGSELVQPGEQLGSGQIYDSNSFVLTSAAREAGAISYRVGAVADDADTLRSTIEDQLIRADIVVTSGGVSVGAYDVVKAVLSQIDGGSGSVEFRRLAMQPGKPQGFGLIGPDRTPVLALPGNPVSAYVSFELFVRPAVRALMGRASVRRETALAVLETEEALTSPDGKRQFLRGSYLAPAAGEGRGSVRPVGGAGSHLIAALAQANVLIDVPEKTTRLTPRAEVTVVLLD